ncbi:MAG: formate dehydrogenase subunit delta [Rhodobacteraceae bacterium]|jgi:formate dehydrogenase subunit delta|nr:formate dehydrogenase subunit delta [Paracoccaceae bacterium]
MQADKIIHMANQIAVNLAARPDATALCAGHINDYWDPRMRADLLALVAAGGAGLDPAVIAAAPLIRPAAPPERDQAAAHRA